MVGSGRVSHDVAAHAEPMLFDGIRVTSPWEGLYRAMVCVDTRAQVAPDDASFVGVVTAVGADEWTPLVAAHARMLATGRYREVLERHGWDVDLLPVVDPPVGAMRHPQGQPGTTVPETSGEPTRGADTEGVSAAVTPNVAPNGVVTVVAAPGGDVGIVAPVGHPVRDTAGALPGAHWDGTVAAWRMPLSHEGALALRAILTGHKVGIEPGIAAALKAAADSPDTTGPAVTLSGERIEIRFNHTPARQDDVKRMAQARWDGPHGCWHTTEAHVGGVLRFAKTHQMQVAPEVAAMVEVRTEPFDYDGTIDGLRGVPVSELAFVRSVPAKGDGKRRVPSLEERLAEYGVESVYDLLSVVPFRYQDRSKQDPIRDLVVGDQVGFLARVTKVGQYDRVKRMIRFTVADGTGELSITFFNASWMMYRFRVGDEVVVFGRLDVWNGGGRSVKQMASPLMDPVGDDTAMIVPVYPQSEKSKVTTWDLHGAAMEAVRRLGELADPFPDDLKTTHDLMDRGEAYKQVHAPDSLGLAGRARTRLAFDELFRMQMALGMRRHATADATGVVHQPTNILTKQFLGGLRFEPTGAQKRVLGEIRDDLLRPHPMNRLLQGDVGVW